MESIGAFSLSLSVKDINKSYAFYESLGFEKFAGNIEEKWLIIRNKDCVIGLFEGMFDGNILTFNPGWTPDAESLDNFRDIRDLQREFKEKNIEFIQEGDDKEKGPGSFMIVDPDGNQILVDQHV